MNKVKITLEDVRAAKKWFDYLTWRESLYKCNSTGNKQ